METIFRFGNQLVKVVLVAFLMLSWGGNASASVYTEDMAAVSIIGGTPFWTAVMAVSDIQNCSPYVAASCVPGKTSGYYDTTFAEYGTNPDAYAKARSSFGNNGGFAIATNQSPYKGVFAESIWSDGFTITGGSGQGSLTLSIALDGTLNGIGANSFFLLFVSDSPIMCNFMDAACAGSSVFSPVLGGFSGYQTLLASIDFTYGKTFYIASYLGAEVLGDGEADFFNSAKFGATAPDGSSITGLSGTTYQLSAVPEPATIALLGLGLAGFAATRRRK